MPYVSRAERERAEWCTIPEAIRHICLRDLCDEDAARRQLADALTDGALGRLRWGNSPMIPNMAGMLPEWGAGVPPRSHWFDVEINWKAGTVRDDFDLGRKLMKGIPSSGEM